MPNPRRSPRRLPTYGLLALALLAGAAPAAPQSPRVDLLVTPAELAARLDDPDLVLLHVGREEEYAAEHIPGARLVALSELAAPEDHDAGTGLSLQMPEPETLARTLAGLGIGDGSRVVVYFADDWVTPATRVLYTLDWIGLGDRSALLDGGMLRWKAEGHPVTDTAPPAVEPGGLTPRVRDELVVDAAWVRDRLDADGVRIIDARAPVHYDGVQATRLHREPVRKGHIPGAANIPFNEVVDDQLRLRSAAELRAIFEAAGVGPGDTVMGYCHLGQYATAVLFAARTLGYTVRLYDGSFQDWGSRAELPVEGPGGGA